MSFKYQKILLVAVLALASLLRFSGLAWGEGNYFHPDENNVAQALVNLDQKGDPEFYAYGQLPLFLALFLARICQLFSFVPLQASLNFDQAILFLRFWSALTGAISVWLVYLLGKKLISPSAGITAAAITAFLPGLIQANHFGTTESLLTFFYLAMAYFSLKIYQEKDPKNFLFTGLLLGLALATKITAAAFFLLPLTASVLAGRNDKRPVGDLAKNIFAGSLLAVITWLIFSPFLVIRFSQTLTTLKYEVAIAKGEIIPFYTRQFLDTIPVWFQGKKILPFLLGWPIFVISLWGVIKLLKEKKDQSLWIIILIPSFIFFLYQSQLFVKWTRFIVPIIPIFSLLFAKAINRIPGLIQSIVVIISCLPGVFFFDLVYNQPDIRWQFSSWAKENIPSESIILSESGNTINLPINTDHQVINFDFYQLEEEKNLKALCQNLEKTDYILIPSRRVFANHKEDKFPNIANYYQKLFSDQLGFSLVKTFSPASRYHLANLYYQESETRAEETWTVFDHPTIRLYQKINPLLAKEYYRILN